MRTLTVNEATEQPTLYVEVPSDNHSAAAKDEGIVASLGLNGSMFLFQLINFAIVSAIIWFLILKPLTSKLTERSKVINESLDNAKKVEENLRLSEIKFQEKIDEAKMEANKIVEKTIKDAEEMSVGMNAKAHADIEELLAKTKKTIEIQRIEMAAQIKKESFAIIFGALEKVLSKKVTDQLDTTFTSEVLAEINKYDKNNG